jgi:enamine deaminase RidA (YjgF/YER057c/UK114 family)
MVKTARFFARRCSRWSGRWIVLAGQTGGDEKGEYQPDMAGQVAVALRRIIKLLAEAGAGPEHIVRLTWYLTSWRCF